MRTKLEDGRPNKISEPSTSERLATKTAEMVCQFAKKFLLPNVYILRMILSEVNGLTRSKPAIVPNVMLMIIKQGT